VWVVFSAATMNTPRIPRTDSIQELARFWESHDLVEFEKELEEVTERIFERRPDLTVRLHPEEAKAVNDLARARGIDAAELIRTWILEKLRSS
jgi:hypothetical protein